jgi:hypothetical protein
MSQFTVQYVNIPASIANPDGSKTFGRIRIRSGTEKNVSDPDSNRNPKLDPKKICKKKPYFQAVLGSFILFHIYKQLYAVLWICDILVRIQIRGSVPLTELSEDSLFMFEDEAG